MSVYILTYLRL